MIVLGLLLMAACAAAAVDAVLQNTHEIHLIAFGQSVSGLSAGALLVAGAVIGLLFALGLTMMAGGFGRARRRRRERRLSANTAAPATATASERRATEQRIGPEVRRSGSDMAVYPTEMAAEDMHTQPTVDDDAAAEPAGLTGRRGGRHRDGG